jgi:hypothetical protein
LGFARAMPKANTVRLNPTSLFQGDAKRLEPHLGFVGSGCVELTTEGPKRLVVMALDIWKDGKQQELGSSRSVFPLNRKEEVSFSVKEVTSPWSGPKYEYTIVDDHGLIRSQEDSPRLKGHVWTNAYRLEKPCELLDGDSKAVFAIMKEPGFRDVDRDKRANPNDTIEENAKRVPWALVITISLRDD